MITHGVESAIERSRIVPGHRNTSEPQVLRGPARILRSKSPEMVRQEIYGYLLTHYALSALRCRAAIETGIDPDRIKFTRSVRIVRRSVTDAAAFSPDGLSALTARIHRDNVRSKNLNLPAAPAQLPASRQAHRHNSYRLKRPEDHGISSHRPSASPTCPPMQLQQDQLNVSGIAT